MHLYFFLHDAVHCKDEGPVEAAARGGRNVAFLTAVILPALLTIAGGAADYANLVRVRTSLQSAADATAIAAVNQFSVSGAKDQDIKAAAEAAAAAQVDGSSGQHRVAVAIDRRHRR